jgi:hypothetical protein
MKNSADRINAITFPDVPLVKPGNVGSNDLLFDSIISSEPFSGVVISALVFNEN